MVVATGVTTAVPPAHEMTPRPGAIEHVVALVIPLHANVDGPRGKIGFALTVKVPIAGGGLTVTVTAAVLVTLPPLPVAVNV